jgi:glutamate N-acetyltransferase / amino-acid N-acetyltransferase
MKCHFPLPQCVSVPVYDPIPTTLVDGITTTTTSPVSHFVHDTKNKSLLKLQLKIVDGYAGKAGLWKGVIGWCLPAKGLAEDLISIAVQSLQTTSALNVAKAICTTDQYPKVQSKMLSSGAFIVGIAKGAGMIKPNMASMLSYITTDAVMDNSKLQSMLSETTNNLFNSISVDGDESTLDTLVLLSSNLIDGTDENESKAALDDVCKGLAADLVRNGELTGHVMKVDITNFPGIYLEARRLGRYIVHSPLFKCAVSGNE